MATATGFIAAALIGLLALLAAGRRGRGGSPRTPRAPLDATAPTMSTGLAHPESLTAVLEPGAEEYLAWLADHHWPADEYLELEIEWRGELGTLEAPDLTEAPPCPQCRRRREDVWPCPQCGRLLHSSCGHGMRRRQVEQPYRTHGTNSEAVIAEWLCTGCTSVVGLDVDRGDEADDDLLR
ncbi:hypothetical protein ACGFNU_17255 [Spirillospora sp. NPDC048911]|uniref:hypothetical protein n=1 Tax=Spirillospora sp. NPDC048911 TaxID=3364527 RepID=UPI003715D16F